MSFKEQLAKHENILNRFKALYINNENQDKKTNNETSSNIKVNNENNNINKDNINNSEIDKIINNYNFSYGIDVTNKNINNNINRDINNNINNNYNLNNNKEKIENKKIIEKKEEQKEKEIDLGKIDNLLDKLNFKRENNINNRLIIEEENNINKKNDNTNINININNNKKFDIDNIKNKYITNNINAFNITDKYYNNKKEDDSLNNSSSFTINNIKKMNQLNSRSEIERIKSKYYSMNLNNIINKQNYLNKDVFLNKNKDNYSLQLNKEIMEIKNKLDLYRQEVKESSLLNKKEINNELNSFVSDKQLNNGEIINNNKSESDINISIITNKENIGTSNKIIENGSNQINIPNLNFKYNIQNIQNNNIEQNDNNSRREIEVEINSFENYINNEKEEKNIIQNNNMNGLISEIKRNSNNQIMDTNNNDFDYSEVLPIIDKVSKLKDLNEIDDNYDKQNANSQKIILTNNNNSNEEEVPDIVNNILDALSNKLITSNIDNNNKNKENENIIEKPKLITKNNINEDKNNNKKIISFQEFLEKEENKK